MSLIFFIQCPLYGDEFCETELSDITSAPKYKFRHRTLESCYEFGSR